MPELNEIFARSRIQIDFDPATDFETRANTYLNRRFGVIGNLERRYKETESAGMREEIEKYMSSAPCLACNGYRLKPEALAVKVGGFHVGEVSDKSIREAGRWFYVGGVLPAR